MPTQNRVEQRGSPSSGKLYPETDINIHFSNNQHVISSASAPTSQTPPSSSKHWLHNNKGEENGSSSHSNTTLNASVGKQVNYLFQLKDLSMRRQYKMFNAEQETPAFAIMLSLIFIYAIVIFGAVLVRDIHIGSLYLYLASIVVVIGTASTSISGSIYAYHQYQYDRAKEREDNDAIEMNRKRKTTASLWFCFCTQIFVVSYAIRRALGPMCHYDHDVLDSRFRTFLDYYFCGGHEEPAIMTVDSGFMLLLGPIAMTSIFPSIDVSVIWLLSLSSLTVFITIMGVNGYSPSIIIFVLWIFGSVFLIADLQMARIKSFLLFLRLNDVIQENTRLAEEFHSSEMRFLIANVAHDLKTPLMSFTSAIDLIANYTRDAHQQLVQQVKGKEREEKEAYSGGSEGYDINTYLSHINSCVQNLRDTNAFMLMTINRCIDYAKATKGVKLVPKQETIDLLDTLQLPLNCLRNVQNRLTIIQKAIPENVCSHIITDKQWLQENLLCLLSNAVKYSSKGEVDVSVQLIEEHSVAKQMDHDDAKLSNHADPAQGVTTQIGNEDLQNISGLNKVAPLSGSSSTSNSVSQSYWLLFEVEDSGIGVPEDAMKFLFQPFKQTQRLAGGTGLGLYSLAKRIEALNGEYGVKNRKDGEKGSVFWFTIPYRPDTVTASVMDKSTKATDVLPSSLPSLPTLKKPDSLMSVLMEDKLPSFEAKSLKILLVDDSLPIVKMTSLMLRKLGHRITAAENGEVAVKTIETEWTEKGLSFDIILMDLQMPVMDGLEATKRIRAMEGTLTYEKHVIGLQPRTEDVGELSIQLLPRHFIVGLSANSDHETEWNAMDQGTDAFIAKPFTVDTFANLINERFEF